MRKPLSIAFIIRDPLPPIRSDVLTLFGVEMPRYGVGVELVGQSGTDAAAPWGAGGMHIVGSLRSKGAAILSPLWDTLGLLRALRRARPDCIQVRDKIASALVGRAAAFILRVPFVYWMSFPIVEGFEVRRDEIGRAGRSLRWFAHHVRARASRLVIYRMVLPAARHIFVQSDAMADWLAAQGFARARMTPVPMGVDAALFDRARVVPSDDARLEGRRVVLYLGCVSQSRRSDFLLALAERLRRDLPDVLLVIAGDAPSADEKAWIRREIAARALEHHVLLTGWLPQERALGYAVRAEVGVSPIPRGVLFDVSSPTKLVEYLALGIASVANDIPDQALIIEQSQAGLCAPMETEPFAAAVIELLNDAPRRAQLAGRGPAYVRTHRTYDILGRNVAEAYEQLLPQRP
jgi:glycosyltransferase involved in cell wall biosynthesis